MKRATLWPLVLVMACILPGAPALGQARKPQPEAPKPPDKKVESSPTFKTVLAKVPPEERMKFLETITFFRGEFLTARIKEVRAHLDDAQFKALLQTLGCSGDHVDKSCKRRAPDDMWECDSESGHVCNTGVCDKKNDAGLSDDGDTFVARELPEKHRNEFLESLDFAGGKLIAADVKNIQSSMPRDEFERLFGALGVNPKELAASTKDGRFQRKRP